jgi:hypothetical protein
MPSVRRPAGGAVAKELVGSREVNGVDLLWLAIDEGDKQDIHTGGRTGPLLSVLSRPSGSSGRLLGQIRLVMG